MAFPWFFGSRQFVYIYIYTYEYIRNIYIYPTSQPNAGDYIAGLVVATVGRALGGVPPLAARRREWR